MLRRPPLSTRTATLFLYTPPFRSLARRFAKEGDTLVLLGRTLSKVKAVADELGAPAMAVECDVSSPESVKKAFVEIAARHPKIDVLINNAAVYEPFLIAEASDAQIKGLATTTVAGPKDRRSLV